MPDSPPPPTPPAPSGNQLLMNLLQGQQKLLEELVKNSVTQKSNSNEFVLESLSNTMSEFAYDPENDVTFASWYSRYEDLFSKDASALDGASKVRLLLRKLSPAAHQRFVDYILPALPKHKTFEQTVDILKSIFGEGISTFRKRFRCLQTVKSSQEDFISYSATVNRRCEEFNVAATKADHFKCLVYVCGLQSPNDSEIRMRLINRLETEPEKMTLAVLVDECNRLVNLRKDTSMVETQEIKAVYQPSNPGNRFKPTELPKTPCWLCGGVHFVRDCGYSSHRCSMCHQIGHKDGYCACVRPPKQNGGHADKPQQKPAAQGQQGRPWKKGNRGSKPKPYSTRIVCCRQVQARSGRKFVEVAINGQQAHLQIDSASDITVISTATWRKIGSPLVSSTSARASTASGSQLQLTSQFEAYVTLRDVNREGTIYVTNANLNILGIDWIERFGLWDVPINSVCQAIKMLKGTEIDELRVKYADVFSEQPSVCSCVDVQLSVKEGAKPVFRPKRPVAYGSLKLVEEELDRLEKRGIITPVTYSEWAAPIVVVRKADKSVRICGDYSTGLNDVLEPHQYPLPTPDEIFASLAGGQVYSILDMRDAYLLLNVAESSRKYLTVNTHRGLYQYNRLPFGIKSAPGAFQQVIDTVLAGLPAVKAYLDDIIVTGRTIEEHKHNLEEVLRRLQKFGLRLKLEKCRFFARSVKYLGHIVDQNGTRPDPEKTKAIADMPAPSDVSTLRAFLGAINYYGKYIPHMRNLRYPLDNLLKSSQAKFQWTAECQHSFETFKRILLSDLALTHYDPSLPIVVSADASNVGLGACIQHVLRNGSRKTVYHVARSLTKAEENYGQIEKEGLALIFAVTRFHRMIFGRHFTLQTDHKPLLAIFGSKKGIPVYAANRLQRWAVTLLNYDFDIEYVRTTEFGNADVLSRLINRCAKPEEDFVIAALALEADLDEVLRVTLQSCNLPLSFRNMQVATAKDAILQQVQKHLRSGWPQSKKQLSAEVRPYFEARDSLSLVHDCILFGDRLVVPTIHRAKVLKLLHTAHPGIERMKALGRSFVYWPSMSADIRDLVLRCPQCAAAAKAPARATPQPWPKSTKPFQRVHVDYAGPYHDQYFLVVVDSFTKWPEIVPTGTITTTATIAMLREIFCRFGMPEKLISDNGRQFTADAFLDFCTQNGIEHIRTPPYHPQSNGQAERFVDTFKRALAKIHQRGGNLRADLDTFLLNYRITPNRSAPEGKAPAELLFGNKVRTTLDLLLPPTNVNNTPQLDQDKLRAFKAGDSVYAQQHSAGTTRWTAGVVTGRRGKVLYEVELDSGRTISSHLNQLRRRLDQSQPKYRGPLPLDILLDTYELKAARPASVPRRPAVQPAPPAQPGQDPAGLRRSERTRKQPDRYGPVVHY